MRKIEYLVIAVSDLKQSLMLYQGKLEFTPIAFSNTENTHSIMLEHGNVRIILSTAKNNHCDIYQHIEKHGEGIREIAFTTECAKDDFKRAIAQGSLPILAPEKLAEGPLSLTKATVTAFGDTRYSFIERHNHTKYFLPSFQKYEEQSNNRRFADLTSIDHLAICVKKGDLMQWVQFHEKTLGMAKIYEEYITTNHSSMNSVVVGFENNAFKIVLLEPGEDGTNSQIQSFIEKYQDAGVQHIAFATNNIISTVNKWSKSGIEFLQIPENYYENHVSKNMLNNDQYNLLRANSILLNSENDGHLYQIFTKPVVSRNTLFFELIQRNGSTSFASKTVNALFRAVEQEQMKFEYSK